MKIRRNALKQLHNAADYIDEDFVLAEAKSLARQCGRKFVNMTDVNNALHFVESELHQAEANARYLWDF